MLGVGISLIRRAMGLNPAPPIDSPTGALDFSKAGNSGLLLLLEDI